MEILVECAANSDTCGLFYPQIFEYANVILSKDSHVQLLNKTEKMRQHRILRMFNNQNLCQKHWELECIRIRVDSENDWTRIFLNPKKKRIQNFPGRGLIFKRVHRVIGSDYIPMSRNGKQLPETYRTGFPW